MAVSLFGKLFGGGAKKAPPAPPTQDYKGYTITAHPVAEGGHHRVSGTISRDGREKPFQRADRCDSLDTAVETTFQKGRLMVDQLGERLFD